MQIGIVTNDQHNIFQSLIIAGIRDIAAKRDFSVTVDSQHDRLDNTVHLNIADYDGFVVIANSAPADFLESVATAKKPLSFVSHIVPGPFPSVFFNNAQGMRELMEHLVVTCGREKPLFVRGVPGQTDAIEREDAYRIELLRHDLDINEQYFIAGDFEPDVARATVRQTLQNQLTFDSVVAADYMMALGIIDELRTAGLAVPDDIAVVGFGDADEADEGNLTTVAANVEELGRCAALQLLAQTQGHAIRGKTLLSVGLVVRGTTV